MDSRDEKEQRRRNSRVEMRKNEENEMRDGATKKEDDAERFMSVKA